MLTKLPFGSIEAVDLNDVWFNEPQAFTPWLALADNLRPLGDALGLDLINTEKEQAVRPFSADIICRTTGIGEIDTQ